MRDFERRPIAAVPISTKTTSILIHPSQHMGNSGFDMYVFRDGRRKFTGAELLDRLHASLRRTDSEEEKVSALIAAGELECSLRDAAEQDARWNEVAARIESVTNEIARAFVAGEPVRASIELPRAAELPSTLELSAMEGFAYYALHPRKFLDTLKERNVSKAAVVGIRTIGVPLSAVVAAALGHATRRTTVRPSGHPYDRQLEITRHFREFVARNADRTFVIVDEGPGLSGSSFLSVAEALVESGVRAEQILMLGSRDVQPDQLRTNGAALRWPRFQYVATAERPMVPREAEIGIGGGWWRRIFLDSYEDQPASWTQLEMAKYLSRDEKTFFKFEGFGHYGQEIGDRAKILDRAGFGARYLGNALGFGMYEVLDGRAMRATDSEGMVERLAGYCAMRKSEFRTQAREASRLEEMVRWNWKCEFGDEIEVRLPVRHLVVADGRMQPHEWVLSPRGAIKVDACTHGDDHFFPGPCDIAWDIAGTIVEWSLNGLLRERFVAEYERLSGDPVGERLADYLRAYATFRMAWSKMAWCASDGQFDAELLERDYRRYREVCLRLALDQTEKVPVAALASETPLQQDTQP